MQFGRLLISGEAVISVILALAAPLVLVLGCLNRRGGENQKAKGIG